MGFAERGRILRRLADLIGERGEDLAMADTTDVGKPISDSRGMDVPRAAANFRFFADHARVSTSELSMDSGHHAYLAFEAAGVRGGGDCAAELPLMLETWKVAPALVWDNAVILKPAENTPSSGTILARLAREADMLPGTQRRARLRPRLREPDPDGVRRGRPHYLHRRVGHGPGFARAAAADLVPVSLG